MSKPHRTVIQNGLVTLAREHKFPTVLYSDGLAQPSRDEGSSLRPRTVLANEVLRTFDVDPRQGQRRALETLDWTFELLLAFDKEVSLDEFTDSLTTTIPQIGENTRLGVLPCFAELTGYEVEHPAQQDASSGTKVRFRFRIRPPRE